MAAGGGGPEEEGRGAGGGPGGGGAMRLGRWLPPLLRSRAFFKPCRRACCAGGGGGGARARGGGLVNLFCLECADEGGACLGCAGAHIGHRVLQIRRSSYHEVVRLQEASKLVNTSSIQPYTINSARVVFLQERPQSRTGKSLQVGGGRFEGGLSGCVHCGRVLQEGFLYCSLNCKLEGLRRTVRPARAKAEAGAKTEPAGEEDVPEGLEPAGGSRADHLQPITPPDTPYRRQKKGPWGAARGGAAGPGPRRPAPKAPPLTHRRKGRPSRAPLI